MEFLKTSQEGLETCEADMKDLGRFIPPVARHTLKDAQDLVNTSQALCDAINESGECRDFLGFWNSMCDFKKKFTEKKAALGKQVKAAQIVSGDKPRISSKLKRTSRKARGPRINECAEVNPVVRGQPGCAMGA